MKTNNDFSKVFGRLIGTTAHGVDVSRLLSPVKSATLGTSIPSSKSLSPGRSPDARSLLLTATGTAKGINFGSPSSNKAITSKGTSEWTNLLKQTASGGISSAFGGGGLGAIGGLGGLISSFAGLFSRGPKAETPLTLFQLPDAQSATVFATSNTTGAPQARQRSRGVYTTPSGSSTQIEQGQPSAAQNAQITQAVKQALLNSSSLNDVIAEI